MLIFFFIVTIYISANLHFFFKVTSLLGLGTLFDVFFGALIILMTSAPVLIPVYAGSGSEKGARAFSYAGYLWLGFLVVFFPAAFIIDVFNFSFLSFGRGLEHLTVSPVNSFFIPMVLSLAVNFYGFFEAMALQTERLVIKTPKLPGNAGKIRVVQISDMHISLIVREKMLEKMVGAVMKESPDIIVSTGDLVDGSLMHIHYLAGILKQLEAPLGKFAVLGNHEIYGGTRHSVNFIEKAGFRLLRGEGLTIKGMINIAGMDFMGGEARKHSNESEQRPEHEILSALDHNLFTLLLKHRSDVEDKSLGLFDLQLSGHTHGGQIFPMNMATMFIFSYHSGFTRLAKGSAIYTSRGTGTSGPPVRFLSKPEITVFDIVKEPKH